MPCFEVRKKLRSRWKLEKWVCGGADKAGRSVITLLVYKQRIKYDSDYEFIPKIQLPEERGEIAVNS